MKLTRAEMVLIAFYRAANGSTGRVPYEEIVVQAWKRFPQPFSLRNYPQYPDASDIHKLLYQTLKPKGFVVSLGEKMFRLTENGVDEAKRLLMALEGKKASHDEARLTRSEEAFVNHARRSRPFATWLAGEGNKLIDYDAQLLFRFNSSTEMAERERRVLASLDAADKAARLELDGADELAALAHYLADKYEELWKVS